MFDEYNCNFLQKMLGQGGQLIDVRSPVEFSQGSIEGAINMPIDSFQHLKDNIDNTKPVLLYCRTGARSGMVKKYLDQLGFDQVHNIGGINDLSVENIKCGGCAGTIKKRLTGLDSVTDCQVDVEQGVVSITGDESGKTEVTALLLKLGYPESGTAEGLKAAKAKAKSFVSCAVGKMTT